jgi:hypothetical protein
MSRMTGRLALTGLGLVVVASLFACVGSVGYGGGGYGPGYAEPVGYDYGGWGGGYLVGPGRGGERRAAPSPSRSYRPAPASRSVPSIPNRSGGAGRGREH